MGSAKRNSIGQPQCRQEYSGYHLEDSADVLLLAKSEPYVELGPEPQISFQVWADQVSCNYTDKKLTIGSVPISIYCP
jgi:hypothetical protein